MARMMIDGKYVADGLVVRVVNTGTDADGSVGTLWVNSDGGTVFIPGADAVHVVLGQFEVVDRTLLVGVATDTVRNGSVVRITSRRGFTAGMVGIYGVKADGESVVMIPGLILSVVPAHQVELADPTLLVWRGTDVVSPMMWSGVAA